MHRPRLLPLERGGFLLSLPRSVPRARPLVRPRRRNRQAEEEECRGCFVFAVSSDIGDDENLDVTRDDISEGDLSPLETADDAAAALPPPLLPRTAAPHPPLPRVLVLHTGGTLGMDVSTSFVESATRDSHVDLVAGTGGNYPPGLRPGTMLSQLLGAVPELGRLASLRLAIPYNLDSSRVGPREWVKLARILDSEREHFDAFLIVSGTDTMPFVASSLSLMLAGFGKPVVLTGSQLPLQLPRSDARQNLVDALTCATATHPAGGGARQPRLREVAVCFGGLLLRGNRAQKVHSQTYRAFESPTYPALARLGVDVDWDEARLLRPNGAYTPRFDLEPRVARIPVVPGADPRVIFGNFAENEGPRGIVLEAFGVGNFNDLEEGGFVPWIEEQRKRGIEVLLSSQCHAGELHPELYRSGRGALLAGARAGPR